jgi:PIN domain nuclease of toxin-antitoxin system
MSGEAQRAIARARSHQEVYLSPVSAWEIGLLMKRGRFLTAIPPDLWIADAFGRKGTRLAALTPEIACQSAFLPGGFHDDPADRLLVATAMSSGLQFVTRDRRILDYGAKGHLPVLAC